MNELVDDQGNALPHLLPVDQTLHWANPPGPRDTRGFSQAPYTGPVPMITHVHGADTGQESDGYPEAWYLPDAEGVGDAVTYTTGSLYEIFKGEFEDEWGQDWDEGTAVFQYPNDQRATTLWYHDHTLGMTRLNVYAGPAGFYLLRGGPDDEVFGTLPGPPPGKNVDEDVFEIPIVIQDRTFNVDGSLFYPDNRAFFEGLDPAQLDIPFIPDPVEYDDEYFGDSDVSPIWNPEFFGNTMVVNGRTWPFQEVQQRRYRFRFLNGCNSRFLILRLDNGMPFYQVGADGGFLPAPLMLSELLLGPAERADVIVDFTGVDVGTEIVLINLAPDEPFGGGELGVDYEPADPATTGQVMQFRVVPATGPDKSTPPMALILPPRTPLPPADNVRQITLNEEESQTVFVSEDEDGNVVLDVDGERFGPTSALLGTLNPDGTGNPLLWGSPITENPMSGDTEIWEIHNLTVDAHPIHVHLVQFEVVEREDADGTVRGPEPWEQGTKDTVIAYPGEITRIKAMFNREGLFVWHCHILEHEDNEMMRPYRVGPQDESAGGGD
jgi:bilirubin oxidase